MSYRLCKKCFIDWHSCRGYSWFQASEIESAFCFQQIFWIILHAGGLEKGEYPPDPEPTGYSGGNSSHFSATAKFQKPADIFSEFSRRLSRTGDKGRVLLHEVTALGAESVNQLSQPAREALYYCAGEKAKPRNFNQWLADRDYSRRQKLARVR